MPLSSALLVLEGLTERMPTMMIGTMRPSVLFADEGEDAFADVLVPCEGLFADPSLPELAPDAGGGVLKRNMRKKFKGTCVEAVGAPFSS